MKSRKITTIGVTIAVLLCIGGCIVKHKDDTKQGKTIAASSTKDLKEDEETIKKKQLAYLKEHEKEIVDFVKAQNPKVESVQIYWDETEWGVAGNGTPQGGDEMILIFGGFDKNPESSWRVDVVVEDGKINLKTMSLGQNLSID
ncbi:MAG: lipoprotein BUG3 [Streptococcus parasanguinis]|nr:lipoprotein BUG3 [Streptococcus parasanguinis]MDU5845119.1 lipoprotein BUG3 [Streptococcus parasanguinis]